MGILLNSEDLSFAFASLNNKQNVAFLLESSLGASGSALSLCFLLSLPSPPVPLEKKTKCKTTSDCFCSLILQHMGSS